MLESGRRVGQYETVRELGRGGMGVVYLARHPLIGSEVASVEVPGLSVGGSF